MRRFLSFVRKEFYHIFRDWRTMLILLVYPVVLILLFGYAVTTEVKNVRVAVLDLSHDAVTSKVCGHIAASRYLVMADTPHSRAGVEALFRSGGIDVAIIFGSGFAGNLRHDGRAHVQILADGSEPNQAAVRVQYVQQVLAAAQKEVMDNTVGRSLTIVPVTRMLYNPQQKSEYNFVPGVIGMILMLICAMMSSIAIVREKESGTMEVLLASPLPPACIILAKLVPYFIISCINLTAILLLSFFLLHVPMAGSMACFLGVTLLYILVSLTLGLLISTLVSTQIAAMILSLLLIVPTIYLSGLVFPLESMPSILRGLSAVVPARWYIDAARKLMIQGSSAVYVAADAAVMAVMEVVLLGVSLRLFKVRL